MTAELKEIVAAGVSVELKLGTKYLIFIDRDTIDRNALHFISDSVSEVDGQVVLLDVPIGKTVHDVVAAFEVVR